MKEQRNIFCLFESRIGKNKSNMVLADGDIVYGGRPGNFLEIVGRQKGVMPLPTIIFCRR